jgi:S1-C subfamily serine protease
MTTPETDTALLSALSNQMADAVERVSTSLVLVNGRPRQPASGIVYANDHVLTADHVLEREEDLTVGTHDGRTLAAQFVGRDSASDLAVLRVNGLNLASATAVQGAARVGQFVLAVGRPSNSGPMASLGVVSAVGGPLRTRRGGVLDQFIQTDATPYPGFSGGPLVDSQGAVVGILTTGIVGGVALGVPASLAWQIAGTLGQHGHVKRGFLGISSQVVQIPHGQRGGLEQDRGLLIVRVEPGSPAEKGGLLLGDVLVSFDGKPIMDTDELQSLLRGEHVGKPITLTVLRGGARQDVQVTVGQRA